MKTKQEFVAAFTNEFAGFLLAAFTQRERGSLQEKGMFMTNSLGNVIPTLERMYDFISEVRQEPAKTSAETLVEEFLLVFPSMTTDAKEKARARLRTAFMPLNGEAKK